MIMPSTAVRTMTLARTFEIPRALQVFRQSNLRLANATKV